MASDKVTLNNPPMTESDLPLSQQPLDDWRTFDDKKCEAVLDHNPMDNFARFRLAEILVR
jgi:hypothetical protein